MAGEKDIKYTVTAEDRFSRTFQTLKRELGGVASGAGDLRGNLTGANASFSALAAGPVAALTAGVGAAGLALRNLAQDLDAFNDVADATGDSVENISGLEQVALRNGANLDLVTTSLVKLNQALAGAKKDSPAADALKAIGLSAAELRQMAPSEALATIAKALQGYENDANKARIVQELFGKSLREVAPFLNDLAEAGERNATVTAEQAKQAEIFNKQLAQMATNSTNAGRSIASALLPAVNEAFDRVKDLKEVFGGVFSGAASLLARGPFSLSDDDSTKLRKQREEFQRLTDDVGRFKAKQDANGGYLSPIDRNSLARLEADLRGASQRLAYFNRQQQREALAGAGAELDEPRFRARMAKLPDLTDKPKTTGQLSEAQRYLESLQRQAFQVQHLTEYERALAEVQSGRLDGLTPKLREQILAQAKSNDLAKREYDWMTARISAQTAAGKADAERLASLQEGNKALEKEIQTIGLTPAALADVELARIRETIALKESTIAQREAQGVGEERLQALYAEIEALRERQRLVVDKVDAEAREAQRAAVQEDGKLVRDTQAESIAQGILDGTRAGQSIMQTFWREAKAQAANTILTPIISPVLKAANSLLENLFTNIAGSLFGSGLNIDPSGIGITSGNTGLADLGLGGGRANGGGVRAGHEYRVNENGIETFRPATDGVILNASQTAAGGRQQVNNFHNTVVVQGDATERTVALINVAIAKNNAAQLRSMRTGGAYAQG